MTVRQRLRLLLLTVSLMLLVGPTAHAGPGDELAAIPAGAPPVQPMLYPFLDVTRQLPDLHPDPAAGPMGSMVCMRWDEVNPAAGVYDWAPLEAALAVARATTVTLTSGAVISQPLVVQLLPHLHSLPGWEGAFFYDATPTWVYDQIDALHPDAPRPLVNGRKVGYRIEGCASQAVLPMYDDVTWQACYLNCVRALGARYDGEPLITAVTVKTGLDGETQFIKDFGCQWNTLADQALGLAMRYLSFPQYVLDTMDVYRAAFPHKALFLDAAPGGSSLRQMSAEHAAALSPPIGLKNSAMWVDNEVHQGYGTYYGIWDMVALYSTTLPIWVESAYGFGDAALDYWSLLAGLHYHPDLMDLHPEYWAALPPEMLGWTNAHLGRTLANTPSVWTAFRDAEFPRRDQQPGGDASGKVGDWAFWLYRVPGPGGDTVRLLEADLPEAARGALYSRQARRTDQVNGQPYIYLDIDDGYPYVAGPPPPGGSVTWEVRVILLNQGSDTLALQYRCSPTETCAQIVPKGAALGAPDEWVTVTFSLDDATLHNNLEGADLRLSCEGDGDEIVHRVEIIGRWVLPPGLLYLPLIVR
jgi:hypothetical protein